MGLINPYNGMVIAGGNMAAAIGIVDGGVGAPGLYFNNDVTMGLYRIGANTAGFAVAGAEALRISPAGMTLAADLIVNGGDITVQVDGDPTVRIDDQNSSGASSVAYYATGVRRWLVGMVSGTQIYRVYSDLSGNNSISIVAATDAVTLAGALRVNGALTFIAVDGAGALAGTLGNSPVLGNPTFWLPVTINGLGVKYIPCW